jgi:hypothetical protein
VSLHELRGREVSGVFAGPGGPGVGGTESLDALETVLDGAALLGLELEPRFRVLAATLEPLPERHPEATASDRRVQLLCHPVSTILASLRRTADAEDVVLTFDEHQLVDVVAALNGPAVTAPLFGRAEPRPGEWGPFSLEGRSTAPDGVGHTVTFAVSDRELNLKVFARFDAAELRDPHGQPIDLSGSDG